MNVKSNLSLFWFCFTMRCDWLSKLVPLSKTKPTVACSNAFSHGISLICVFASNYDWFIVLCVSVVIGQSNHFGFGFTTLN